MSTTFPPQTRTPKTEEAYRKRIAQIVEKVRKRCDLSPEIRPTERQMSDHFTALKPTVKKSTWRQYEAAIVYWIETTGEWQDEVLHDLLSDRARAKLQAASAPPHGTNRTSAAKEKDQQGGFRRAPEGAAPPLERGKQARPCQLHDCPDQPRSTPDRMVRRHLPER